jgi:hypothetical protein
MTQITDWLINNLAPIALSLGGVLGGMILRHISPRIAGWMRGTLDRLLAWLQGLDEVVESKTGWQLPGWVHETWDDLAAATVGAVQQLAGDPVIIVQAFKILRGKPDLRRERLIALLEEHISQPDFAGILKANLPDELKELWNEAMETVATKTISAKTGVKLEIAKCVVKQLAPAAEVEALKAPVESKPMRSAEIQNEIEKLREKIKADEAKK